MKKTLVALSITLLAVACGKQETAVPTASGPGQAPTAAGAAPQAQSGAATAQGAQASVATIAGPVLETMDSGGYTYMKIKAPDGDTWVATPQVKVKKGDVVSVVPQMTAEKFESSTLKRTFDKIVFGTFANPAATAAPAAQQAAVAGASQFPPAMQAALKEKGIDPATMTGGAMGGGMQAMGTPADHMKPKVDIGDVNVPKAEGADAKTVAEVWGGRAALSGKEVVVRGKVVKFLGGIMGTNFMHVRDGSGSQEKGDNDLTVTTDQMASVGDVVTLRGSVIVDKDFGAGYRYPVLVEKAKITK